MKYIKIFGFASIPFGLSMEIIMFISNGTFSGIIGITSGLFFGVFFTLFIWIFTYFQSKKNISFKNEFSKKHKIIYDTAANHFIGAESVGGWLYLTPEGIYFKSHKYNIQNHEKWVYFTDIKSVSAYRVFGFVNTGLLVITKDSKENKYVVDNNRILASKIKQFIIT